MILAGRRSATMRVRKSSVYVGRNSAYRKAVAERWLPVYEMSRVANTEIRRNLTAHFAIRFDGLVFTCGQPILNAREIPGDGHDVLKMLILDVSGVMPAKVPVAGSLDKTK